MAHGEGSHGGPSGYSPAGTRDRLLDAAETLFAERGIDATSLRDITTRAGANLAAVNYHFGSKDELARQVFARHLDPLNAERIALLDQAEREAAGRPLPLVTILHALLDPTISLWTDHRAFMRILGRLQLEPDEKLHDFHLSRFEEVIVRFKLALTRTLPHVPLRELFWRMHFIFGAMVQTWTCSADLEAISEGLCKVEPYRELLDRLVAFGVAGLCAPVGRKATGPRTSALGAGASRGGRGKRSARR